VPKLKIQTAKALKSIKVKRTQVIQGKKQKISVISNENKKQATDVKIVVKMIHFQINGSRNIS